MKNEKFSYSATCGICVAHAIMLSLLSLPRCHYSLLFHFWIALVPMSGLNEMGSRGHLELGLWPWALETTEH